MTQYYDRHGDLWREIYNRDNLPFYLFNRLFRKGIFERWELCFSSSQPVSGKSLLDIGCGAGLFAVEFARQGARRVVGVDISAGMVEQAAGHARAKGVADRCQFVCSDFMNWKSDETFDQVYALGVFDYVKDAAPFLGRMAEKSRRLVVASFPGHSRLREPLRKLRYKAKKFPVYFYAPGEIERMAAAAGLKPEIIPYSSSGYLLKATR